MLICSLRASSPIGRVKRVSRERGSERRSREADMLNTRYRRAARKVVHRLEKVIPMV